MAAYHFGGVNVDPHIPTLLNVVVNYPSIDFRNIPEKPQLCFATIHAYLSTTDEDWHIRWPMLGHPTYFTEGTRVSSAGLMLNRRYVWPSYYLQPRHLICAFPSNRCPRRQILLLWYLSTPAWRLVFQGSSLDGRTIGIRRPPEY